MRLKTIIAALAVASIFAAANSSDVSAQAQSEPSKPAAVVATIVTVKPGDTLSNIATAHATTYVRLYDANAQIAHPDIIHPGENVRVPTPEEQIPTRALPAAPVAQPVATAKPAYKRSAPLASAPAQAQASGAWGQLAACESGGNPTTNTGNGYYGAYQFSASTWRSVGGSGLPSQASMEEQTARAQALQARSGWGQWPACTAKLGLR